jgi:hypothetical protein
VEAHVEFPSVRWDREVNAAYLSSRELAPAEDSRKLPVVEADGEEIALLRFASSGELVGVELLDAANQIPSSLRDNA